jgi:hypothetical protein
MILLINHATGWKTTFIGSELAELSRELETRDQDILFPRVFVVYNTSNLESGITPA